MCGGYRFRLIREDFAIICRILFVRLTGPQISVVKEKVSAKQKCGGLLPVCQDSLPQGTVKL